MCTSNRKGRISHGLCNIDVEKFFNSLTRLVDVSKCEMIHKIAESLFPRKNQMKRAFLPLPSKKWQDQLRFFGSS